MSELCIKHRGPNSSYPVSPGTVSPLFDFTESPRATAEAAGEMAHPGAAAHVQVWGRCCSWEQGWEKPKKNPWSSSGPIWHQNSIQQRGEAGVGGKAAPSLLMGTKRKQMEISRYDDVKR